MKSHLTTFFKSSRLCRSSSTTTPSRMGTAWEDILRFLLSRPGIRVVLLSPGGVLAPGIYDSEGRILLEGWERVKGVLDVITGILFRYRSILRLLPVLVILIWGRRKFEKLQRRGAAFFSTTTA